MLVFIVGICIAFILIMYVIWDPDPSQIMTPEYVRMDRFKPFDTGDGYGDIYVYVGYIKDVPVVLKIKGAGSSDKIQVFIPPLVGAFKDTVSIEVPDGFNSSKTISYYTYQITQSYVIFKRP